MPDDPLAALCRARIAALGRIATMRLPALSGAVGMRPMVLTPADVTALHQHSAQPTARPKLPLRAIPEMEQLA
jgi:hypothetical protein